MYYEVDITVRLVVEARDVNAAENHVISMMETHLADMMDSPAVAQTIIPLSADNPKSREL